MKKFAAVTVFFVCTVIVSVVFFGCANKADTSTYAYNKDLSSEQNKVEKSLEDGIITFNDPYLKSSKDIDFVKKEASFTSTGTIKGTVKYKIIDVLQPINIDQKGDNEYPFIMEADYPDSRKTVYLVIAQKQKNKFIALDQLAIGKPDQIESIRPINQTDAKVIVDAYVLIGQNRENVELIYDFENGKIVAGQDNIDLESPLKNSVANDKPVETDIAKLPKAKGGYMSFTFDDGPDIHTGEILDILKQENVKATFFLIGSKTKNNPDLVKRIIDEGHSIGNHTYNHISMSKYSLQKQIQELQETEKAVNKVVPGMDVVYFRPPYGQFNADTDKASIEENVRRILWTADSYDWAGKTAKDIANEAIGQAQNGIILLMHDGVANSSETVKALPAIIKSLKKNGFKIIPLTELVNKYNF